MSVQLFGMMSHGAMLNAQQGVQQATEGMMGLLRAPQTMSPEKLHNQEVSLQMKKIACEIQEKVNATVCENNKRLAKQKSSKSSYSFYA